MLATWPSAICTASSGFDTGGTATAGYSGSPLAFSFSERHHHKSVTLAEIGGDGAVTTELLRHAGAQAAPGGARPPR